MPKEMTAMPKKQVRHKWKDDTCVNCGLEREMRSWKLLMAMVGSKDYYQYGRQYAYSYNGWDTWSWNRPDCNHELNSLNKNNKQ